MRRRPGVTEAYACAASIDTFAKTAKAAKVRPLSQPSPIGDQPSFSSNCAVLSNPAEDSRPMKLKFLGALMLGCVAWRPLNVLAEPPTETAGQSRKAAPSAEPAASAGVLQLDDFLWAEGIPTDQ